MSFRRVLRLCTLLIAVGLATVPLALGQATTSLTGTVSDPSGAAIAGAKVTLTNEATSVARATTTTSAGEYTFVAVLPGTYALTVEMAGFRTYLQKGVTLRVNLPETLNVQMQVGALSQHVEVTSQAFLVNTTDSSLGNTMGLTAIQQLPLQAEQMPLLLSFQPGVVYNGLNILTDSYDTRAGAVNGEHSDQNNISLDGVSINDEFSGYAFSGVLPTTQFSIQEFRVTTSNYDATQGRSAGAQMAMVTIGGTNHYHGSLYEFNRTDLGEANDFFLNETGQPRQHLVRNVFGGTLGGPIKKDKLFFFVNYEGHRESQAISEEQAVPGPLLRDGTIEYQCNVASQCPGGGGVPAGYYALTASDLKQMDPLHIGPSPVALSYFNTYPEPNDPNFSDAPNFEGYRFGAATTDANNWYIGRVDYNINSNNTLFARGAGRKDSAAGPPFLPGRPPQTNSIDYSRGFVAGYTATVGGRFVNNLRYGLTRESTAAIGDTDQPWVLIRDLSQDINYSGGFTAPVHNLVETATWMKGRHTLGFGGNLLFIRRNSFSTYNSFSDARTNADWVFGSGFANVNDPLNPAYGCSTGGPCFPAVNPGFDHTYDFPLAGLMGIASEVDARYNYKISDLTSATPLAQGTPLIRHWATDTYNLFSQDSWKVKPHLTITYGLNYQLMTPITETAGQQVTPSVNMGEWFNQRAIDMEKGIPSNQDAVISFQPSGSHWGRGGLYSAQTKNFAPRVGVAWSPHAGGGALAKVLGEDKTVIRAGFGVFYDNFGPALALQYDASGEFGVSSTISNPAAVLTVAQAPRLTSMNTIPTSIMEPAPPSTFPVAYPDIEAIANGIDQSLRAPYSLAFDFSIQRQLPGSMLLDLAYVAHLGHRILGLDDVAEPMDVRDPASGIDYFAAAKRLSQLWRANTPESSINAATIGPTAQYWINMLQPQSSYTLCSTGATTNSLLVAIYDLAGPGCGSLYNETLIPYLLDVGFPTTAKTGLNTWFNAQYSSLWDWRSIGHSSYNSFQAGLHRQATKGGLFGLNYTYSRCLDIESEAERGVQYLTDSIINAWDPNQMYGPCDYDIHHQINGFYVAQLPFGRGKKFGSGVGKVADAVIGGWQWGGTGRWTSGFPVSVFQGYVWPTNWDEMGWSDLTGQPIWTGHTTAGVPNIFTIPALASQGFSYAYPGESGVRNPIRGDGFFALDMNLQKSFRIRESNTLSFRWSVFNVSNTVRFDAYSMQDEWDVPTTFGNYSQTLTSPRVMEFAAIYQF